jgi:hypothetical protein
MALSSASIFVGFVIVVTATWAAGNILQGRWRVGDAEPERQATT